MRKTYYIVRYPKGAYGLYSQDGFLHIADTIPALLKFAEGLGVNRKYLAFRYY